MKLFPHITLFQIKILRVLKWFGSNGCLRVVRDHINVVKNKTTGVITFPFGSKQPSEEDNGEAVCDVQHRVVILRETEGTLRILDLVPLVEPVEEDWP